jgi:hypothetical protein
MVDQLIIDNPSPFQNPDWGVDPAPSRFESRRATGEARSSEMDMDEDGMGSKTHPNTDRDPLERIGPFLRMSQVLSDERRWQ